MVGQDGASPGNAQQAHHAQRKPTSQQEAQARGAREIVRVSAREDEDWGGDGGQRRKTGPGLGQARTGGIPDKNRQGGV